MSQNLSSDPAGRQPANLVESLAGEFLAQLQAGENPDRQALVRAHPDLSDQLERRLAFVEMAYRVGLGARQEQTIQSDAGRAEDTSHREEENSNRTRKAEAELDRGRGKPRDLPDYELLGELGHGGMGIVYKARQISLNRVVALKMIPAGALASRHTLARFNIEAEALASLQHPNIVQVYEVGEYESCPYLAMEFLDGGTLADQLGGKPQPPRLAAELIRTLSRAIHCAHQRGIIHRDLKPANVLLQIADGRSRMYDPPPPVESAIFNLQSVIPKITDFGLAKRLTEDKGHTATGVIMGTPSYMAPEQAGGRVHDIGPQTDVYALGSILYEMLTGKPPFQGNTGIETVKRVMSDEPTAPTRLYPKLPRDLETICLKCLEKEPGRRYASAEALADDLGRFLEHRPIAARSAGLGERAAKWVRRRPALATLIGVIIGAAGVLAGSLTWSYTSVRYERDQARQHLQTAREAVDRLYTKMAMERLFDEPQLDPLCQELLERAQVLYKDLAREHSADPQMRRDIALASFRLGEIHRMRDQNREAEDAYGEAIAQQEELHHEYPQDLRYGEDLANSHNWLGELFREHGRPVEETERHYRAALELQQALVHASSNESAYRMELARSHYNLGIIERETDRLPEAGSDYDQAIALLTELHHAEPKEPNVRQDLARALINRGILHRQAGRPTDARHDYDQAIELLTGLSQEFPARAAYKFELAIGEQDLGNLLLNQGQKSEAKREQDEALKLLRKLVADFSSRPRYQKKKGNVLKNLGVVAASTSNLAGAEDYWSQAQKIFETLVEKSPEVADYHAHLGMTLGNLGWLRIEQKNWPKARQHIEEGIERMRSSLQQNPKRLEYRQELRNQYRDLAWTLVHLGDPESTARAATNMADVFPRQPQYEYFAACFIARCVPMPKDDQQARQYVAQAVDRLRVAVAKASSNLERIPDEEQVFQPLKAHPDFAALMRQLDTKAPRKR